MNGRLPISLAVGFALAGCAVPDLGPKLIPRAPDSIAAARSLDAGAGAGRWPADRWWTGFGDPQLTALIEEGLANAPDVSAAAARYRRAAALARQAGAARLPQVTADGTVGLAKQSYNNGFPREFLPQGWQDTGQVNLRLDFDLDLWGRNRATLAAATSEAEAAAIDASQARLMLSTGIADAYAELIRLDADRTIQARTLDLRLSSQKLIADRQVNGLETRGSVRQADATVATARANLAALDEAIALRRNQIAALVGAGPDRGLTIASPRLGGPIALGLPQDVTTELVVRRPDVAAALRRAEAAASRIKVARADFFPALRLSGLVGLQALGIDRLVESGSTYGNVGPAISLPIFRGGQLRGRYREARAVYDEAVATYDDMVLTAYREVADAVASRRALAGRLADARAARQASEEAYQIARARYEGGLSTYLDVLDVEDRLLAARQTVADLETRAVTLDVALIRALGGGFVATPTGRATLSSEDASHG